MLRRLTCILLLLFLLTGCAAKPQSDDPVKYHQYDLSALGADEAGFMTYRGGRYDTGVDVSTHQGSINWKAVAADGIDFAMIRVGYRGRETGALNIDRHFAANVKGALQNGIKVGVYFYSQATTKAEAEEEAYFVLKQIAPYKISYPVAFDLEMDASPNARANSLTSEQRSLFAAAFCNIVQSAGYTPCVYGSASFLVDGFDLLTIQNYPLWVAHYTDRLGVPYDFAMWQYTASGRVDGINKKADLNICLTPWG